SRRGPQPCPGIIGTPTAITIRSASSRVKPLPRRASKYRRLNVASFSTVAGSFRRSSTPDSIAAAIFPITGVMKSIATAIESASADLPLPSWAAAAVVAPAVSASARRRERVDTGDLQGRERGRGTPRDSVVRRQLGGGRGPVEHGGQVHHDMGADRRERIPGEQVRQGDHGVADERSGEGGA